MAAYTIKGNATSSTANATDISIPALTQKATPVANDIVLLVDSAASNALKYATVSSLAATNVVSSIAGNTGAFTLGAGLTNSTNVILINPVYLRGYISGLTLSNNVSDATNDIDIAVGVANADDQSALLSLSSGLTKRLDANWAVGTNQGGLDTGAIANTTYHLFLIQRSDTLVVDVLFSTSPTSPTMPANYDRKRRIGSIVRTGAAIKAFTQSGFEFLWKVPVADIAATNPGTSAVSATLTLPTGIQVIARFAAALNAHSAATTFLILTALDQTDTAPSASAFTTAASAAGISYFGVENIRTNTSAQVRYRVDQSDGSTIVRLNTHGWVDTL